MHQVAMRVMGVGLCTLMVAACAPMLIDAKDADFGPKPTNPEQILKAHIRATFVDPYSVRDLAYTDPRPYNGYGPDGERGWTICYRMNAKNRMGGYTGIQLHAVQWRYGHVVGTSTRPCRENYGLVSWNPVKTDN